MIDFDNKIIVYAKDKSTGMLLFPKYNIETMAYLGRNGVTTNKIEGDGKTPLGIFKLGVVLGTHKIEELNNSNNIDYKQITPNMYLVDDPNSNYYNKLVDISEIERDWNSAEHLIDYPVQYEYLIEIKTNPYNIPYNGSAIFLHCHNNIPTGGCIAINRFVMEELVNSINKNTKIEIICSSFIY